MCEDLHVGAERLRQSVDMDEITLGKFALFVHHNSDGVCIAELNESRALFRSLFPSLASFVNNRNRWSRMKKYQVRCYDRDVDQLPPLKEASFVRLFEIIHFCDTSVLTPEDLLYLKQLLTISCRRYDYCQSDIPAH